MDSELQKALAWVDSGPGVVGAKHINALAEAAREWERLGLTRCDTCGGSKYLAQESTGSPADVSCPACEGLGWLIPDKMVEAAANTLNGDGYYPEDFHRDMARTALVAAFTVTEAPDGQ